RTPLSDRVGEIESRRCGGGDERAFGDVGEWFGVVVPARRDVVRSVGVKQQSERLDMLAADIEFELAAAVGLDVVCGAVSDGIEQGLDGGKPGGLDVEPARCERQRLDALDPGDRMVPAHSAFVALDQLPGV